MSSVNLNIVSESVARYATLPLPAGLATTECTCKAEGTGSSCCHLISRDCCKICTTGSKLCHHLKQKNCRQCLLEAGIKLCQHKVREGNCRQCPNNLPRLITPIRKNIVRSMSRLDRNLVNPRKVSPCGITKIKN